MKRLALMLSISLIPGLATAQDFDVKTLAGEDWYGLYLNGQKSGYAVNAVKVDDDGTVTFKEDARFKILMSEVKQDMRIVSSRVYGPDGALRTIESQVDDPRASTRFHCVVEDGELVVRTTVGNEAKTTRIPKPQETLRDGLKHLRLLKADAKVGDETAYSFFEPFYQKEIAAVSRVMAIEERMFDGVSTRVYEIKTLTPALGIESVSYVTQEGTTLEDNISGMIKMRLEPEQIAKDVNYSNDVIVSNAAMLDSPIPNARKRESLRLLLKGPLGEDHLFNDERQSLRAEEGGYEFVGRRISLDGVKPPSLPVDDTSVREWLRPTTFVQSDHPSIVKQAQEIVGGEKDSFKAVQKLCHWVYRNVHTTFSARLTNALEVLESREGDCTEHSILFVALARAAGIPAREVAGLIYVEGPRPGFYFHQWASVWVGKWVDVDPTFDQPLADVTHIKLAEGDLFTQAKLIPIIGRITVEVRDDTVAEDSDLIRGPGEPA